jgi:phage protein D
MSTLADRPLLYSARPALKVAGRDQPALAAAAVSLAVGERWDGLFTLEATFGNWGARKGGGVGYVYLDRALVDFGAAIEVTLGAGKAFGSVFDGRITAIEGRFPQQRSPEVLVLAEDRLQDLRMTRRTRVFENKTVEDIVGEIATGQKLDKAVDVEPVTLPVMAQLNQSDLAFLRQLARIVDADVWVEGKKLRVQARARRRGASVTLAYGQSLYELSVSADLAHQRTSVDVTGWNATDKAAIAGHAGSDKIQSELEGGVSGLAILSEKFGDRPEQLVHEYPLSSSEARARAEARLRSVARRFVTGRGVSEGDARIRVGAKVTLQGLGDLFDGAYFVSEAKHLFDYRSGYRTAFTIERPWLGRPR